MANGNNQAENNGEQQIQAQAAGAGGGGHVRPPTFNPQQARHESAHAVVIDDLGYNVIRVNINPVGPNGKYQPQVTQADWGAFQAAMNTINWADAAQRDAIRPSILGYVTMLVAGHLAENMQNGVAERVSARIQHNQWLLQNPPRRQQAIADRDKTALFLYLVQRNTMLEVIAAEERATEVLRRRAAHHEALTLLLTQHGTVEGEMLDSALGHDTE